MKKCILLILSVLLISIGSFAQQKIILKRGDTLIIDNMEIINVQPKKKVSPPKKSTSVNYPPQREAVGIIINYNQQKPYSGEELAPNPPPVPITPTVYYPQPQPVVYDELPYDIVTWHDLAWVVLVLMIGMIVYFLYRISQPKPVIHNTSNEVVYQPPVVNNTFTPKNKNNSLEDKKSNSTKEQNTDKVS